MSDDNDDIFDIEPAPAEATEANTFADELELDRFKTKDLDALANENKGDPYELFSEIIDEDRDRDHLEYSGQPKLDTDYGGKKRDGVSMRQKISSIDDRMLRKKAEQEAIALMTACGITQASQAQLLGMSLINLRKVYRKELDFGKEMLITRVANAMVQKAIDGNVAAGQFILKSKGGWREPTHLEISTPDAEISDIEREQRLMRIMLRNPALQAKLAEKKRLAEAIDVTPGISENEDSDIFEM